MDQQDPVWRSSSEKKDTEYNQKASEKEKNNTDQKKQSSYRSPEIGEYSNNWQNHLTYSNNSFRSIFQKMDTERSRVNM